MDQTSRHDHRATNTDTSPPGDCPARGWLLFVNRHSLCQARCQVIPATFHKAQESAGQLANPIRLAKPYRFPGDQFTAYAERYGASDVSADDGFAAGSDKGRAGPPRVRVAVWISADLTRRVLGDHDYGHHGGPPVFPNG